MVGLYGPHDDPLTLHHIFEPGGEGGGGKGGIKWNGD